MTQYWYNGIMMSKLTMADKKVFPKGTIARNNRTDEKFSLDEDTEALQDDKKGEVWRTDDSRGHYIRVKDNESNKSIHTCKK